MIAALYVEPGGVYFGLDDVDPWDEARDARKYAGPHPVVAHPPCARWCQLAKIVEARYGYKRGDGGGCFEAAVAAVRKWGGVLEHPAITDAWARFGIIRPTRGAWSRSLFDPGWTTEVSQVAYGHMARKRTWLYYVGEAPPPAVDWSEPPHTHCTRHFKGDRSTAPEMPKRLRSMTPLPFRDLLLGMARTVG